MDDNKIRELFKRSKDKRLPREARQQAARELEWIKYRNDRRPSMTYKKFMFYEMLTSLGSTLCFGWMAAEEISGTKSSRFNIVFFPVIMAFLIVVLLIYVSKQGKYKTEPADELAKENLTKAGDLAFRIIFITVIVFVFIMGLVTDLEGTFTISWYSLLFVLVAFTSLQSSLQKIIFFKLDGKETAEEE